MAKSVHSDVLDGANDIVRNACNVMTICSQEPTTRTQAVTDYMLVSIPMTSGSFTKAANSPSGRKLTVSASTGTSATNSGTATHVAFCDGTRLLYVDTCTSQVITAGNLVNTPAFDILKIENPT